MTLTETDQPLHLLGVREIADQVAAGSLRVTTLVEALLARIEAHDPVLQSFSYLDRDEVLREAARLDQEAAAGNVLGPLHGVPFGVKEQFLVEGVPTWGDPTKPPSPPAAYSATAVERLRNAGALLLGKLHMTGPSGPPPTRNPWNTDHTPGGTSSGSGAAVGARFVPFSLAEQSAGSGLRPAAYCGVSGFKPTYGRNPRRGMFQMSFSHDHVCIIATSIPDIARIFAVTSGHSSDDPTSLSLPPAAPVTDITGMRPPTIGIVRNFFPDQQQPEMNAAIEVAAQRFRDAGATITEVELPEEFSAIRLLYAAITGVESALIGSTSPTIFGNYHLGGRLLPGPYYVEAQRIRGWLRNQVNLAMAGCDAVMMGTTPAEAPEGITSTGNASLLIPWSHLGNPAITIPAGLGPNGLPLGLQLVAPTLQDETLLATGAWCENVLGLLPAPELAR